MTRIIAGTLKGRSVTVPKSVTRPTASRVREALFSAISHMVNDFDQLHVLDLFAGSGALGIEAISRGATHATFMESDHKASECISKNLNDLLGVEVTAKNVHVHQRDVMQATNSESNEQFNLVFIDPPYAMSDDTVEVLLDQLSENNWLGSGAIVVVERSSKSTVEWPDSFDALQNKTYGDTSIWYGQYTPDRVETS